MKTFAQFYTLSTGYSEPVKLIEACGSDSVYQLDGRLSYYNSLEKSKAIAKHRGFKAFKIMKGISFTRCWPISELIEIK